MTKKMHFKSFDEVLLAAIDESLIALGESVKDAIYFQLENLFKIKRQEIPSRIDDFSVALEQIFGLGARCLEILFMKNLHTKIKVMCSWPAYEWPSSKWIVPEMTFKEYVKLMRQNFEIARRQQF